MSFPLFSSLRLPVLLACSLLFLPSDTILAQQQFDFANAPLGEWVLEREAPSLKISHPSVALQIREVSEGPSGSATRVLEMTGDNRGFRNIKDFAEPIKEGVIQFDLRIKAGGLLLRAFESARNKETRGRGVVLLFNANGRVESIFGALGDRQTQRHTSYKRGVWYRGEVTIRLSDQGGGTYDVRITDLSTGEALPLANSTGLPIDPAVQSIGGWDFDLVRSNSEVELDRLIFSPTLPEVRQ